MSPKEHSPLIIDAHLDLSWNALGWNRNLEQAVAEIRRSEADMQGKARGRNTVSLPEMRSGRIGICLATVLARCNPAGRSSIDFRTQEAACATARGQLAYYRLLEERGLCRILRSWSDLQAACAAWHQGRYDEPLGFILSMEGADPIVSVGQAEEWYRDGLRAVGLAHYGPSAYAHGTGCEGPLTARGRELLPVLEELGVILDLTHLADESFWEALELFRGTVIASHNNCRALVPAQRQFSDDQIRAIIERGGVIGAAFDAWMLVPGWGADNPQSPLVSLESVAEHIDHICQLSGNCSHIAIGSDLDGGFGTEQGPHDLDTIADLQAMGPVLSRRGYTEADLAAIFHGNWMRIFEVAWAGSQS
ncbi:MAG TPA: membrane dipeptidase [Terracidiphilus sp.]|nr:membrane dipeptidase [Terracidiphilus sp.]